MESGHVYMDFVPSHEWLPDEAADTLVVHVPGFKKEQLRVHIGSDGKLLVSGERPLIKDQWRRFRKEFQLPENCKAHQVHAKFENGLLSIVLPKQHHRGAAMAQKEMGGAKETEGDAHGGTRKANAAAGNQTSRTPPAPAPQGEEVPSDEQTKLKSIVSMDVRLQPQPHPHDGKLWVVGLLVAVLVLAWYLYQKLNPEETHRHGACPAI